MCVKVIFLCNVKGLLVPVHPVPDLVDPGIPVRSIRILDLQCMVILPTHTEGHEYGVVRIVVLQRIQINYV